MKSVSGYQKKIDYLYQDMILLRGEVGSSRWYKWFQKLSKKIQKLNLVRHGTKSNNNNNDDDSKNKNNNNWVAIISGR